MSKLELKHIVPYLPYGLKVVDRYGRVCEINTIHWSLDGHLRTDFNLKVASKPSRFAGENIESIKPILRPMSDLDTDGDAWFHKKTSIEYAIDFNSILEDLDYCTVQLMIANHFDIFGLIDQGLAIDINHL